MNIAPVSSSSNTGFTPLSEDNVIKLLEKQKMQLQDQIRETNQSKLDDKTKQDRVKLLQEQIQQIDMEIQQRRTEKLNQNKDQQPAVSGVNAAGSAESGDAAAMSHLVQASATYSQAKVMQNTKDSLNGKGNVLKVEIKLDEGRGVNPKAKKAELQKIEANERMLDKKTGESLEASQKQVKESVKAGNESKPVHAEEGNKAADGVQNTDAVGSENTQKVKPADSDEAKSLSGPQTGKRAKAYTGIDIRI